MTLPDIQERQLPNQQNAEQATSSQAPRYRLRANRAPRHKCGTCGSRNCSCVHLVTSKPPDHRLARGAVIPAHELSITRRPEPPQHNVVTIQTRGQELPPMVQHLIIRVEKTYTSVNPGVVRGHPLLSFSRFTAESFSVNFGCSSKQSFLADKQKYAG